MCFLQGKFLYLGLKFEGWSLKSSLLDPEGSYNPKSWLERVIIVGLNHQPGKVTMSISSKYYF